MSELLQRKDDLSDRFGAMTVKELRQGLRRGMFMVPFIVIQLLAVLAMLAEFNMGDVEGFSNRTGVFNPALFFDSGPFWMVAGLICILIMPLGGLALMGQELEEGNHELLLMTPLTRWRVVRGKFLAMWGLCLVTFVSLLPYMIVRYFIGGIDAWRNIVMSLTVICASAVVCSGAIGASSFRTILGRIVVMLMFLFSLGLSGVAPLMWSSSQTDGCGILYHLNALAFGLCYVIFGLSLARSRIRLVVHNYEVKPSWMVIGLLIFTPLVVSMATAMTIGYGGFVGLLGMAAVAWYADVTPTAPKWVAAPVPNIPPQQPMPPQR
ncbi:ABC transporter permease subunit [Verrucomicrobiaceae bacterium R5-34]|uniref:ABC transporter permease subunit n=1 Tax=Oceaniferula flava TaxID=2800421 RepID=A0AAE2SE20_9BACT|nr:ABC transporter permease subunit [Oceaniferula flavus]MBK1830516.1 ABC transporter permease subunit [Verrucomicrobiaceae bacterium R5-34]MBK1854616.1 ABC transporter permease subunit [Oceaniferula flavus]MBM1135922.1 ABC transporter permease subunit [Oceaniferula flavus]